MELEPVVVFFPLNLAISPALNRVSKTEAVIMSHDPAKNNSTALTWLPPCQAGQMPRLWGVRAWRPARWPKPPKDLPCAPSFPLRLSLNLPPLTANHTAAFLAQKKAQTWPLLLPSSHPAQKTLTQVNTADWGQRARRLREPPAVCL